MFKKNEFTSSNIIRITQYRAVASNKGINYEIDTGQHECGVEAKSLMMSNMEGRNNVFTEKVATEEKHEKVRWIGQQDESQRRVYSDEYREKREDQFLKLTSKEQNLGSSNTYIKDNIVIWYTINHQKEQKASLC